MENINKENDIKLCIDGALPLIAALIDKVGIVDIINSHTGETQEPNRLTTGEVVKALIMNIIVDRKGLYKISEFYGDKDTEKLFRKGILPKHFTDDRIGVGLDALHEIGSKKVLTEIAMSIINKFDIKVGSIHGDTTAKNVHGEYKNEEEGAIKIKRGHSKDFRPDLKQILFGLGTTKERIVVIGNVCDGNTNDKDWNKDILKDLRECMKKYGLKDFIYTADCALVSEESLKMLCGDKDNPAIPFITRLPGNYNLENELKERALNNPNGWETIGRITEKLSGAEYKVQSFTAELYGKEHKFLVYHSSHLEVKKEKTIDNDVKKEKERLKKLGKKYEKKEFSSKKDASEEVERLEKELRIKYHQLQCEVEEKENKIKRKGGGRPKKGELPEIETVYRCKISYYKDEDRIQEEKDKESLFVLIGGNIEDRDMTERDILKEYKEQSSVETSFRVLKDPHFIDELFVKKPHRVEALAYVMLMALMILTLLERNVREGLRIELEAMTETVATAEIEAITEPRTEIEVTTEPKTEIEATTEPKTEIKATREPKAEVEKNKEEVERVRVIVSGNRKTHKPTGVAIIEALEKIQVRLIYDAQSGKWERTCKLNDNLKRLIRLAGFDESIYTEGYKTSA